MTNLKKTILFSMLATLLFSCKKDIIGEGPVTTRQRSVSAFTGIELQMNGNVYYKTAPDFSISVTARESIHSILETNVVNGKLIIRYANGKTYDNDPSNRVEIAGPAVNSFATLSSGDMHLASPIHETAVHLASTGSGSIYADEVMAANLEASSLQSGFVKIRNGHIAKEVLKTDGSGKIDVGGVTVEEASARIEGSGDIRVKAPSRLSATIKGSGDLYFTGSPNITTNINGTGRLIRY